MIFFLSSLFYLVNSDIIYFNFYTSSLLFNVLDLEEGFNYLFCIKYTSDNVTFIFLPILSFGILDCDLSFIFSSDYLFIL
jgi:hypothetical protein